MQNVARLFFLVEEFDLASWGNTEPGIRRAAESVLGGFVPSRQHRFADFQLQGTLSGSADGMWQPATLAFRNLIDFRSFRLLPKSDFSFAFR